VPGRRPIAVRTWLTPANTWIYRLPINVPWQPRAIWHRFQDKRRFQSKIANFSHTQVFNTAAEEVPLGIGLKKTRCADICTLDICSLEVRPQEPRNFNPVVGESRRLFSSRQSDKSRLPLHGNTVEP